VTEQERAEREAQAAAGADAAPDSEQTEQPEQQPPPLDPVLEARRLAALSNVRTFGDPALRTKAAEVTSFDRSLADEVRRMTTLMEHALGVGLAATQLGVMHRVLIYRAGPDAPLVAVVNPRLEWQSDDQELLEEACLSLPGVTVDVERPLHVRVSAREEGGEQILIEASGLEARVLQHEMDHLDGVLILDRTSKEQRKEAMRSLRETGGSWPAPERAALQASPA
jgi:peptide deformylase